MKRRRSAPASARPWVVFLQSPINLGFLAEILLTSSTVQATQTDRPTPIPRKRTDPKHPYGAPKENTPLRPLPSKTIDQTLFLPLYLQRTAILISELEPVSVQAPGSPAVLRLDVKFILAFIAEKDQNAQRFTYLCDALQWHRLKISKMNILRSLAHTSHALHTSYIIYKLTSGYFPDLMSIQQLTLLLSSSPSCTASIPTENG